MKSIVLAAALAAPFALPAVASAQAAPAAKIVVVNTQQIYAQCKACKVGEAALQSQAKAAEALQKSLGGPLQTEQAALQKEIDALNGADPSAALKAKVDAFQKKGQAAQTQVANRSAQLQRNGEYVRQQINAKLGSAIDTVMKARGANLVLELNATLDNDPALDVSAAVLAELDRILPSVNTTAPAAAPAAAPAKK